MSVRTNVLAVLLLVLTIYTTITDAAALTASVPQRGKSCYFAWVDQKYEKVGFYFAVQEGGDFDVDYTLTSPHDKIILHGEKSSQEDFVFTANEAGEYSFCFENRVSTHEEKLVDFDITVESEPRLELPLAKAALLRDQSSPVEESMSKIDSDLTSIERTLRYFRLRDNQGYVLVDHTQHRITRYSIFQALIILGVSVGQVYMVKYFFDRGSSASRFRV